MKTIKEIEKEIDSTKNCFHYNSESRKRPFECLFCGKDYTSRGIDRHLSYAHGIVRFDFGIREARIETLKEVLEIVNKKLKDDKNNKKVSEEGINLKDNNLEYHKNNLIRHEANIDLLDNLRIKIEGVEEE